MEFNKLMANIEAILFASGEAVPTDRICEAVEADYSTVEKVIRTINDTYEANHSALTVLKLGNKYQMTTAPEHADIIRKALEIRRNQPLSQAAFEVLAIIAYKQPVTKAYIDQTRGVDCTGVISGLCEKGLIEEAGRLDLPGRPLQYVTTENFLRCFSLSGLDDLEPIPIPETEGSQSTQQEKLNISEE